MTTSFACVAHTIAALAPIFQQVCFSESRQTAVPKITLAHFHRHRYLDQEVLHGAICAPC